MNPSQCAQSTQHRGYKNAPVAVRSGVAGLLIKRNENWRLHPACLRVYLAYSQKERNVLRMPIKPLMVRSLSRHADDWQGWQAGWAVHVVPLINCQQLGCTWVNTESTLCETKCEKSRQSEASLLSDRMFFCSLRLISPKAQFVAFCRAICLWANCTAFICELS